MSSYSMTMKINLSGFGINLCPVIYFAFLTHDSRVMFDGPIHIDDGGLSCQIMLVKDLNLFEARNFYVVVLLSTPTLPPP